MSSPHAHSPPSADAETAPLSHRRDMPRQQSPGLGVCPDCAGPLIRSSGCLSRTRCGWGQCGGWRRGSGASGQAADRLGNGPQEQCADRQLDLLPRRPTPPLPVLDERARGTKFIKLSVRSVLNTPATTHMGFWSINPYVGCEFGCTYCYARDTHRWVVERVVGRYGGPAVERSGDPILGGSAAAREGLPPYRRS